jgi:formylmethanofuran dehydrogenase subunit B
MDNVPIRCRKVADAPEGILSDKEILERIYHRVKELKGEAGKETAI